MFLRMPSGYEDNFHVSSRTSARTGCVNGRVEARRAQRAEQPKGVSLKQSSPTPRDRSSLSNRPNDESPAQCTAKPTRRIIWAALLAFGAPATPLSAEPMSIAAFRSLSEHCAPGVAPDLLERLVATESGFNPLVIGVNGAEHRSYTPKSASEAATLARAVIAEGHSIDLGLGQINNANLDWLGLTLESVFDPCANLAATETVLRDGYGRARAAGASKPEALGKALSSYNTGSFTRGFANGYVARVLTGDNRSPPDPVSPPAKKAGADVGTPWNVFGGHGFTTSQAQTQTNSTKLVFQ